MLPNPNKNCKIDELIIAVRGREKSRLAFQREKAALCNAQDIFLEACKADFSMILRLKSVSRTALSPAFKDAIAII